MKTRSAIACLLFLLFILPLATAQAQDNTARVQEFYSVVSPENEFVYFDLFGMEAGTTIYLYSESDAFDTYLVLCDLACEETFADNDDIDFDAGNTNSALSFTFTQDGDYSIAVTDCCVSDITGAFRLLIGYDAPAVLDGSAVPNGARIAIPYEPTYTDLTTSDTSSVVGMSGGQVQQFIGNVSPQERIVYYDIFGASAGETLYAYTESSEIDTYLVICDIDCVEVFAENDDIDFGAGITNSAIEFSFPAAGDYSIAVRDCCNEEPDGSFRLLLGYNAPSVLTGDAVPTGAEIAQEYQPNRASVVNAEVERSGTVDCSGVELGERPTLTGPMLTRESENFVVHYTLEGADGATESYAQAVLDHLELTLAGQLEQGWALPPSDCGEGGDERFDLYLSDLLGTEGVLGTAAPQNIIGDNANSPAVEQWAAYSYMNVDNDFREFSNPMVIMRATVDHEFNHAVQFGYDVNDAAGWLYEATASWVETSVNPQDEDAADYALSLFQVPDLCMGSQADEDGLRIYGEWLLLDSIAQDFGNETIKNLWEIIADFEDNDAYYQFLSSLGTTPQDVLRRHAIRNLVLDYQLAPKFNATVAVETIANGAGTYSPRNDGVEELGVDYVLLRQKGLLGFAVDQPNLRLIIVGIDQRTDTATAFDLGSGGVVDTAPYSYSYAIIMNTTQHDNSGSCQMTDWTLTITDGSGQTAASSSETFDAVNFIPAG